MKQTLYDILGVAADAEQEQILLAYRNRTEGAAGQALDQNERVLLNEAFSILSQANRRAAYDASLTRQARGLRIDTAAPDLDDPPSRRWLLWLAGLLVIGGAIYAWPSRKAPPTQPVVVDRVVVVEAQSTEPAAPAAAPAAVPAPAAAGGKSAEELFAQLAPSTAMVIATNKGSSQGRQGSGVVIDRGTLITNCHVTRGSTDIEVRIGGESHYARVETADEEYDLCRLSVSGLNAPAVSIAKVGSLRTGQRVLALGAPKGLELTISEGIVSSLREVDEGTIIQTTAPISPGSSGGGLFNTNGELVGIITLTNRYGQNLNFAVPADWIEQMRDRKGSLLASEAAGGTPRNPANAASGAANERILGGWHCFRPDFGRHVNLQFLRDGSLVGMELDHSLVGRYAVNGEMLTLYGARQYYFRIEDMTDNHMVLAQDHLRLACDKTP